MSIDSFSFTKDWTNPVDFPTYEDNETQVRDDMQYLFNELKAYINEILLPGLTTNGAVNTMMSSGQSVEDAVNNRYTKLEADARTATETNDLVKDWSLDTNTGVMTITKKDGTAVQYDTALEKVPATFELVTVGGNAYLKITNVDGTSTQTDVTALLNTYNFSNTDSVAFTVTGTGGAKAVTANVRPNSITLDMLALDALTQIQNWATQAKADATAAATSEANAKTSEANALSHKNAAKASADSAQTYAETARVSETNTTKNANQARLNAFEAKSWAVGGTGYRSGEDTNNAKYWSEQARKAVGGDYATKEEAQGFATTAENNAKAYTDEQIEESCGNIPDALKYQNSLLYLMSGDKQVGLPVQIIGGTGGTSYATVYVSGYATGAFTATEATNTFTVPEYTTTKVYFFVHDNLSLVKGVNYTVSDTGVVVLDYTLQAGETVYWSTFDTGYDANYLENKEIFDEAGSAEQAEANANGYTDEKVAGLATTAELAELETELKNSVGNGKTLVANAITAKGVSTATDATFETMAANVAKIEAGTQLKNTVVIDLPVVLPTASEHKLVYSYTAPKPIYMLYCDNRYSNGHYFPISGFALVDNSTSSSFKAIKEIAYTPATSASKINYTSDYNPDTASNIKTGAFRANGAYSWAATDHGFNYYFCFSADFKTIYFYLDTITGKDDIQFSGIKDSTVTKVTLKY